MDEQKPQITEDEEQLDNAGAPAISEAEAPLQRRDDQKFMRELENLVRKAEENRLRYMKSYRSISFFVATLTIISVCAGTAGFAWFFLMEYNLVLAIACIVAGLALPPLVGLLKRGPLKSYERHHKAVFMPQLAQALGGFKYFAKRGISSKILGKTGVIAPFKLYEAEDCFMGVYKGVKVIMSEARLYQDQQKKKPVFDGLFALLELPSPAFSGHTIITADREIVKNYAHTLWAKLPPVQIPADAKDASRFEAFSNRPDAAAQQVNTRLINELADTSDIFDGAQISTVFLGKKFIFLAIPCAEDLFEASNIFVPVTLQSYIKKCKGEIEKILEIIDIFEIYAKSKA